MCVSGPSHSAPYEIERRALFLRLCARQDSLLGGVSEAFRPALNEWRTGAPLLTPRSDHGLAPLNGSLIAGGGMVRCLDAAAGFTCNTTSVERYDPVADSWTELAPLLRARRGLAFAADEV